jgi:hypothetical protein
MAKHIYGGIVWKSATQIFGMWGVYRDL